MKRIEILEIGNNCLKKVSKFVLEGFDELRSVSVGTNSFYLDKKNREGSKYVIINCENSHLECGHSIVMNPLY